MSTLLREREAELEIPARDGYLLAATLYTPPQEADHGGCVIINAATAVRRRYYALFARYLSEDGFTVVTYDYRGIGDSRPERLQGFEATMLEWGTEDFAGVVAWVQREVAPSWLAVVGHSVGGQVVGLAGNVDALDAMVAVSAQSGYWRLFPVPERYRLYLFWRVLLPGVTYALGYLPARRLGLGEDLPRGVLLQWAGWCLQPDYLMADARVRAVERFSAFRAPILAYSVEDDPWATRQAVDALMQFYTGAPMERRHVRPDDVQRPSLGHFGFFRPACRPTLWAEVLGWLKQQRGR